MKGDDERSRGQIEARFSWVSLQLSYLGGGGGGECSDYSLNLYIHSDRKRSKRGNSVPLENTLHKRGDKRKDSNWGPDKSEVG